MMSQQYIYIYRSVHTIPLIVGDGTILHRHIKVHSENIITLYFNELGVPGSIRKFTKYQPMVSRS